MRAFMRNHPVWSVLIVSATIVLLLILSIFALTGEINTRGDKISSLENENGTLLAKANKVPALEIDAKKVPNLEHELASCKTEKSDLGNDLSSEKLRTKNLEESLMECRQEKSPPLAQRPSHVPQPRKPKVSPVVPLTNVPVARRPGGCIYNSDGTAILKESTTNQVLPKGTEIARIPDNSLVKLYPSALQSDAKHLEACHLWSIKASKDKQKPDGLRVNDDTHRTGG